MEDNYLADNAAEEIEETLSDEFAEDSAAAVNEDCNDDKDNEEVISQDDSPVGAANTDNDEITKTQAFSMRLNEMTQRNVDKFVETLGWVNPYNNEPIKTQDQYNQYLQMQEANKNGQDPIAAQKIASLENRLLSYAVKEQDAALLADPIKGEIYKELRPEVFNLLEYCKSQNIPNVDINGAFSSLLANNFDKVLEKIQRKTESSTVKKIASNKKAGVGALGDGSFENNSSVSNMSDAEFEKLVQRVLKGEKVTL